MKLNNQWDIIFPVVNLTEQFNVYKNYLGKFTKSLFLKWGPWFSKSNQTIICIFYSLFVYPFLWILFDFLIPIKIIYYLFNIYLNSNIKIKKNNYIKTNFNYNVTKINKKINKKYFYKYNFDIIQSNYWFTRVNYILCSTYASFGKSLFKKILNTIFL